MGWRPNQLTAPQLALTPLARFLCGTKWAAVEVGLFGSLVRCAERAARYWNDQ